MFDYLQEDYIQKFIRRALMEDLGDGDHSSLASVPLHTEQEAYLLVKGEGILAGEALAHKIFHTVDPNLKVKSLAHDGDDVRPGDIIMRISGKAQSILKGERLVLNCMQRMSGIASQTKDVCTFLEGTSTKILDTRKTTPNARLIEKWAVKIGGGQNHRYGLFDMIMLKDNHIDFAGGIRPAIERTLAYLKEEGLDLKIEVETRDLNEVKEVLEVGGADIIMLDNMSNEMMKEAVEIIAGRCTTEASGGITPERVRSIAECGVDFISMGALTHSYTSLDISLKAEKQDKS